MEAKGQQDTAPRAANIGGRGDPEALVPTPTSAFPAGKKHFAILPLPSPWLPTSLVGDHPFHLTGARRRHTYVLTLQCTNQHEMRSLGTSRKSNLLWLSLRH